MAAGSTIFKIDLQVADMDRGYYDNHALTIAQHPSETVERMMLRVYVFASRAHERLEFGGGVSTSDEPDLWRKSLSGEIEEWIEVGQPDTRRVRRACGRARTTVVYCHGGTKAAAWWRQEQSTLAKSRNLEVYNIPLDQSVALGRIAERTMSLQCSIQDGEAWFSHGVESLRVAPERWKSVGD